MPGQELGEAPPPPCDAPPHLNKQGDLLKDAFLRAGRGKHPVKAELVADILLALAANVGLREGGERGRVVRDAPPTKHFLRNSAARFSPKRHPCLPPMTFSLSVVGRRSLHTRVFVCVCFGGTQTDLFRPGEHEALVVVSREAQVAGGLLSLPLAGQQGPHSAEDPDVALEQSERRGCVRVCVQGCVCLRQPLGTEGNPPSPNAHRGLPPCPPSAPAGRCAGRVAPSRPCAAAPPAPPGGPSASRSAADARPGPLRPAAAPPGQPRGEEGGCAEPHPS